MKRLMIPVIATMILAGCDYIPRKTFKITTTDGKQISLTCPVVASNRNTLTYLIDGQCVVEPTVLMPNISPK